MIKKGPLRRVIKAEVKPYDDEGRLSKFLTLECGDIARRKGSAKTPQFARCSTCAEFDKGTGA